MPAPANLVHQTATSTGTGNFTLAAVNGKQKFSTAFSTGSGNTFDYFISNRDQAEYERGIAYMDTTADMVRSQVIETSLGTTAAIDFTAGTKDVTNDVPAGSQYFAGGTDVAVADGGTGAGTAAGAKTNLGFANIATGSYTGDGATSQAITGIGFTPKYVWIVSRQTADAAACSAFYTSDTIIDDNASGGAMLISSGGLHSFRINRIIALGSDGFTVDDSGSDLEPNTNGTVYNYMAIG